MTHRSHHRRVYRRSAFTLMEMLVVVAIIVVLAGTGGYLYMQRLDESRVNTAKAQVKVIEKAIDTYRLNNDGALPPTLEALTIQQPLGGAPIMEADKIYDPWKKPYGYDANGTRNGGLKADVWAELPTGETVGNWPGGQ